MIVRLWILATISLTSFATVQEGHHKISKICTEDGPVLCEGKVRGEKLTCRGDFESLKTKELFKVKILTLCQWNGHEISPQEITQKFPNLQRLAIRGGNITELLNDFPSSTKLEAVVLTGLSLMVLNPGVFDKLENLKFLDLTKNNFRNLDSTIIKSLPLNTKVHLAGNPWNCSSEISWIFNKEIQKQIVDFEKMTCGIPYPGKPVFRVMNLIHKMEKECAGHVCSCEMVHIVWDTSGRYLHPVIAVNCSNRGLQRMPVSLPSNTTTVYLMNNKIADVASLAKGLVFSNVLDVYLDFNKISSLNVLEGADWLKKFRVFSIKSNFITEIPNYAFDHAFGMNSNLGKVYFGGNPWLCNCEFTPVFQQLLIKYETIIRDIHEIKCQESENEHSLMQVMELSKQSICYEDEPLVNPLDIVSGILAFLIVLVLGKLLYDYWAFKRTGKLPWIVAKMP